MRVALLLLACALLAGCGEKMSNDHASGAPTAPNLARLETRKIYFGHQSVGFNIVDGIRDVKPSLALRETRDPADFNGPVFAHARNGRNAAPLSKIEDFASTVRAGIGGRAEIAMFKFCYVDVNPQTDIKGMFEQYRRTMNELKDSYPGTTFVHITIPVTVVQSGPKAWVKQVLGKPLWGADANVKRAQFNRMMLAEYGGKEPVFDLAKFEATAADGSVFSFKAGGDTALALRTDYTDDGEHLNPAGRRWVAQQFLSFLSTL